MILSANLYDASFKDSQNNYKSTISKTGNNYKFSLVTKRNDSILLRDYLVFKDSIYNFKTIDVNQDGVQDFCIGFVKTTRWNSTPKPKIHIYSHKNGKIYPIWRSSRIGTNLVDFEIDSTDNIAGIKILDNPRDNVFNISLYRWKSFGLKFVKYIYTDLDSLTSIKLLRSGK